MQRVQICPRIALKLPLNGRHQKMKKPMKKLFMKGMGLTGWQSSSKRLLITSIERWPTSAVISANTMARSEEHTSELQSLRRISYAVFCLKKKTKITQITKAY